MLSIGVLVWAWAAAAQAQEPTAANAQQPAAATRPFEILDNSFLVEEAYNQEAKIVQNIFTASRSDEGEWAATFTQEWPAPGVRHQLSYSLVLDNDTGPGGLGDVAINYRYQLRTGEDGGTAVAPRLSLLVRPSRSDSSDAGRLGLEMNLPASRQFGDVYLHGNAGVRIYPSVDSSSVTPAADPTHDGRNVGLASPFLAGSAILRVRPMLNVMLESVALFNAQIVAPGQTGRETTVILSPGARFGWNVGDQQLIFGVALPIAWSGDPTTTSLLGYASWELPFRH